LRFCPTYRKLADARPPFDHPGATYFFTVVTYRRRAMLCEPDTVALSREAFATVKHRRCASA
jgi:REP element-mobilizing transposase RayT